MPEPSQSLPAAEGSLTDSQGPLDPTAPRPDGTLSEPNFAPPERAGEVGTFGRYRVLKKLGQGGMGAVYLGYDGALERKVALKVMLPRHAAGADARERFLREARSAAKIKSDHVVTIHDVGEERGVPFIAMEYLLGYPLDQYLKSKGELPLAQVLRVARETAIGLAAAHGLGLVHRDVKPANLWLEAPNGRVKLLDFGLARATDDDVHLTNSGAVMGTPAYMSPEQGRGLKVDHRSDLFSLGVLLYRLCTGKMPFTGATTMAVLTSLGMDTPTPPRQLNPQLPEALEAIVTKLLAKNPAERFQTATEVADAIRTVEQAKPTSGPLPVVVPLPVQPLAVGAQTQNVWDGIEDSGSVAVPLASSAEAEPEPAPAPRPQRRRPERRASKWPALLAVGVLCAAVAVFAAVLLRPSNGTLIVESDDPDAELLIKKDGETVRDRTKDREFALPTGTYTVELADPKPGLKLDRDKVEIAKNGTSRVAVRLQKPPGPRPAAKPKDKDTPPAPAPGPMPDAVIQAELGVAAGAVVRVTETNRKGTSCPVLLTWDGERFAFVTDFLGGGALGESGPDGSVRPPRPEESVKIEPGQLVAKDGQFVIKIAEPMDEVLYLDHLRLEVIDLPPGSHVFPDERFVFSGPEPSQKLLAFRTRHFPKLATDHRGRDVTKRVLDRDRRAVDGFARRSWLGYAEDHALALDFGELPAGGRWHMVLAGWTEYPYPESMYAATRAGVDLKPPALERLDAGGTWQPVCDLGFPAGLPRVMTRDLPADFRGGTLRISTNMQVYWDQVYLARAEDAGAVGTVTTLDVARADLANRGFMQEVYPDGRPPVAYDDAKTEPVAVNKWKGHLTRLGDVTDLLRAADDRFVLCGPGDEVTVRFDATKLPALPAGWTRSFVLRTRGYCKDTSTTTVTGGAVGPLPFRAMPNYPAFGAANPPATDAAEWHTRPAGGR